MRIPLVTALFASTLLSGCLSLHSSEYAESAKMPLLSKRIFHPDPNDTIVNLMPLRTRMRAYAKTIPEPFGLYFEYLPSGASIGINEQASFIEASLLKVPIVMKAYQLKNDGLLSFDDVVGMEEADIDRDFGTFWQQGVGTNASIRSLIDRTLQQSDNTALQMLGRTMRRIRPGFADEIFDQLDIPKEVGDHGVMVSAKNYTSILRSLYLAASLPKHDAQEILKLLTETDFNDMLPAGVPDDVPVAHKVGVYGKEPFTTFGDCGIVYIPRRPYALCMFVHASEDRARTYMREFSRMTYEYISTANTHTYEKQ